jgi:6-phosphogluconolactonase
MSLEDREILIFKDIEEISNFIIKKWFEISERAIKKRGRFTVALSGGKTPVTLYQKLAELKDSLPWDKTDIFLVDERFVPYVDAENNYHMIKQTLLNPLRIPKENIHPISTKEKTPEASASLFPNTSSLTEIKHLVIAVSPPDIS